MTRTVLFIFLLFTFHHAFADGTPADKARPACRNHPGTITQTTLYSGTIRITVNHEGISHELQKCFTQATTLLEKDAQSHQKAYSVNWVTLSGHAVGASKMLRITFKSVTPM